MENASTAKTGAGGKKRHSKCDTSDPAEAKKQGTTEDSKRKRAKRRKTASDELDSAAVIQALKKDPKWSNIFAQVNKGVQQTAATPAPTPTVTKTATAPCVQTPLRLTAQPNVVGYQILQQPQILSSPSGTLSVVSQQSQVDSQTFPRPPLQPWASWTGVRVLASTSLELINDFFTSGYFPVLHQYPFLQDYQSSTANLGYCSPALVSAILALSCKRAKSLKVSDAILLEPMDFYKDALSHLVKQTGLPLSLPDSQAMALLALYQLSYGDESVAARLVQDAMDHSMSYYEHTEVLARGDVWHNHVRMLALCGSVALGRISIISVFAGRWSRRSQAANSLSSALLNVGLAEQVLPELEANSMLAPLQPEEKAMQRLMTVKFFELTEILQQALRPVDDNHLLSSQHHNPFYVHDRCLKWYGTISKWMPKFLGNDAFAESLQLFYYFCTLSIWHRCFHTNGRILLQGVDLVIYSASISDIASRGIFDYSLSMPFSPYILSAPYMWPLYIYTAGHVQLKLLHSLRKKRSDTYEKMQAIETDILLRRAYVESAISRLQGLGTIHQGVVGLCQELTQDYKSTMNIATD